MPRKLFGLWPNHWNKYTASYHRQFINRQVSTLKGRERLRMTRDVCATRSQYFIETAVLQEMQEAVCGQVSTLPFQSWMAKAVIPSVIMIGWLEHLIKHQGWFSDTNKSGAVLNRPTSWLGLLVIPIAFYSYHQGYLLQPLMNLLFWFPSLILEHLALPSLTVKI